MSLPNTTTAPIPKSEVSPYVFLVLVFIAIVAHTLLRLIIAPQFSGIDDVNYLATVNYLLGSGELSDIGHPLFRFRVGMSLPLVFAVENELLALSSYWHITLLLDSLAQAFVALIAYKLFGTRAAIVAACLWAFYPLAATQSTLYMPTVFQSFFISASILLVAFATNEKNQKYFLLAFFGGFMLGMGYLFKEDTALLVFLIAIAGLISKFKNLAFWFVFACGAATVFFSECIYYFAEYGTPLIRITSTGSNASEVSGHISGIWHWSAYIRSLLVMPYQVGIYWWLTLIAVIIALKNSCVTLRFLCYCLFLSFAWLQFGTGSFFSYDPLPKVPRYTVLSSIFVILILTWWLNRLWQDHNKLSLGIMAAGTAASVACILFISIQGNERTRNTIAVLPELEKNNIQTIYTDHYSAKLLSILTTGKTNGIEMYHANFSEAKLSGNNLQVKITNQPSPGQYVFIDNQQSKIYTLAYEIPLPSSVEEPPSDWQVIWKGNAYAPNSLERDFLEFSQSISNNIPAASFKIRIQRFLSGMIDSDSAVLYYIPEQ